LGLRRLRGWGPEGLINGDHGVTGRNNERPGPNEALAAGRAGIAPVVTKPDRFARPYPMRKNIIKNMATVSQKFRLPTGITMRT
jgi:hypothetical protein